MNAAKFGSFVALALCLACESAPTKPGNEHPFDGQWEVQFYNTGALTQPTGTLELKQEGDSLKGSFHQKGKAPVAIERGYVKAGSLFFRLRTNLTADAPKYLYILKGWREKGSSNLEGTWWYTRGTGRWVASPR